MPELPEVETVRATLWPQIENRLIMQASVLHSDIVSGVTPAKFEQLLTGARFAGLRRRGKYLELDLEPADWLEQPGCLHILIHLRMTGRLLCATCDAPHPSHTHLRLELDDGRVLLFADTRRFGRWTVLGAGAAKPPKGYTALGPEPLGDDFTIEYLAATLRGKRRNLKSLLLDQHLIAGIGNIYADEILFRARLHPARRGDGLTPAEATRLWQATRAILAAAIGKGGTTIRDYVDGRGRRGEFVQSLQVYGRDGQECAVCGATVSRIKLAGRSTHFCPGCQPAPLDEA